MDSDSLTLPLREGDTPGDADALYDDAWMLITQTIRKNAKHKSARTILNEYLDDTREDGDGSITGLNFVFLSPASACNMQMAVTAHWFRLAVALAGKELQALCTKHGFVLELPKMKTALALANEKQEIAFIPHGEVIVGVSGKEILVDEGSEPEELSRATAELAKKVAKSGKCACAMCETIRAGKASVAKVKANPVEAPSEPPAGELATYKSVKLALKKPERCGCLDLSKPYKNGGIYFAELPESIGALTNMTELSTSGTITRSLPKALFRLQKLERLRLGHVETLPDRKLPDAIGDLSRLVEFKIGQVTTLPKTLTKLTALESLDVMLTDEVPSVIAELTSLKTLRIRASMNREKKESTLEVFKLKALTALEWHGLSAYPSTLRDLPSLRSLSFGEFSRFAALPPELRTLAALEELQLDFASFTEWPDVLNDLPALKVIDFTRANKLTSLDGLRSLPALETLRITETKLTELPAKAPSLPRLKTLDIRGARQLTSLPEWVVNLPALERVRLALVPLGNDKIEALKKAKPGLNVDLYIN